MLGLAILFQLAFGVPASLNPSKPKCPDGVPSKPYNGYKAVDVAVKPSFNAYAVDPAPSPTITEKETGNTKYAAILLSLTTSSWTASMTKLQPNFKTFGNPLQTPEAYQHTFSADEIPGVTTTFDPLVDTNVVVDVPKASVTVPTWHPTEIIPLGSDLVVVTDVKTDPEVNHVLPNNDQVVVSDVQPNTIQVEAPIVQPANPVQDQTQPVVFKRNPPPYMPLADRMALVKDEFYFKNISFTTNFIKRFDHQESIGACHIFSFLEVLYDKTGLDLSKKRAYLDHLFADAGFYKRKNLNNAVYKLLNYTLKSRAKITNFDRCNPRQAELDFWSAGHIFDDLRMLKAQGGVLMTNNREWEDVGRMVKDIETITGNLVCRKPSVFDNYIKDVRKSIQDVLQEAFQESLKREPNDTAERVMVRERVSNLKAFGEWFNVNESNLWDETGYLIVKIARQGTAYVRVNFDRFEEAKRRRLGWKLDPVEGTETTHAVAVVGYSGADDTFVIKDSNEEDLVFMSSQNLLLCMKFAVTLVEK